MLAKLEDEDGDKDPTKKACSNYSVLCITINMNVNLLHGSRLCNKY